MNKTEGRLAYELSQKMAALFDGVPVGVAFAALTSLLADIVQLHPDGTEAALTRHVEGLRLLIAVQRGEKEESHASNPRFN